MIVTKSDAPRFQAGDQVRLAEGTYQGHLGVFLRLRADTRWADITERDGSVRSHPIAWLAPALAPAAKPTDRV